jgi:hypothetical protein
MPAEPAGSCAAAPLMRRRCSHALPALVAALGLLGVGVPLAVAQKPTPTPEPVSEGMNAPNVLVNGRFEKSVPVVYPWTGVDQYGYLRKSVQEFGVNLFVDKSNQFSYAHLPNSASFVDLDGDGLPDLVAPDGAGFFWFWKNIGKPGAPDFGLGEVMNLLVDNERSRFGRMVNSADGGALSRADEREKERIDERREKALERLKKGNDRKPESERSSESALKNMVEDEFPYPWENAVESEQPGTTSATLNGFRHLRAVAAPCDWDGNGVVDFLVGDAQGTTYFAKNLGSRTAPNFTTYRRTKDRLVLKLALEYNPVTRRSTYQPVEFMNYAMPYVVDWDRNGVPDILVGEGTYSVNCVRLFRDAQRASLTAGRAPNETALVVGEERTFLAPFAWDWDGDGHLDLFVNDDAGRFTVYPNREGRYTSGNLEMTDPVNLRFEGEADNAFFAFCVPQPCDWNADGVMDIVWSEKFGRIMYALGKEKGGTEFGPPTPVWSSAARRLKLLRVPDNVSYCAVPTLGPKSRYTGGTADGQRYYSQDNQDRVNQGGWARRHVLFYGLMPSWHPEEWGRPDRKGRPSYGIPKPFASWAVAPVPYEVFDVIDETPQGGGEGKTFRLTWHDPATNAVFRQPRDAMTRFGQGASLNFSPRQAWSQDSNVVDENIRCVFRMKLEGRWERMDVTFGSRFFEQVAGKWEIRDGGHCNFRTMTPPPTGAWFTYDAVVPKGKYPRGIESDLTIQLIGRGNLSIRDVEVSTTSRAADSR